MNRAKFNFNFFSKYRTELMGIATLMVLFRHSSFEFSWLRVFGRLGEKLIVMIVYFKDLCNTGVDIFLFLSAIGLYYSFSKNENIKFFYIKRLKRILIPVTIFEIVKNLTYEKNGFLYVVSTVLGINLLTTGGRDIWFIPLILYLYLIYPFIYKVEKKYGNRIILLLIFFVILFNLTLRSMSPNIFNNIEIALRRIPVFLLGCYIAEYVKEEKEIAINILFPSIIIFVLTFLIIIIEKERVPSILFLDRYIGSIFSLSICTVYIGFRQFFDCCSGKILKWFGERSLEIYLIGPDVLSFLEKSNFIYKDDNLIIINIICIILTCVIGSLLKIMSDKLINI